MPFLENHHTHLITYRFGTIAFRLQLVSYPSNCDAILPTERASDLRYRFYRSGINGFGDTARCRDRRLRFNDRRPRIQIQRAENPSKHASVHLPDEVLRLIFAACLPHPVIDASDKSTSNWIQTTAVCSRWRAVALSDSSLWHRITGNLEKDWVSTFLQRSGARPLDVTLMLPQQREVVGDVLENITRIQALCLQGFKWDVSPFITALTHEAPQLERFVIQIDRPRYHGGPSITVPSSIFSGKAPHLREFHVSRDVELPPAMPLYSHLRVFSYQEMSVFAARQIIPRLTSIDQLHFECSSEDEDFGSRTSIVNLTLAKLSMEFLDARSSIDLTRSLHLPSLTRMSLVLHLGFPPLEFEGIEETIAPIAALVRTIVNNTGPLRELEVRQEDEGWILYRAFGDKGEGEADPIPLSLKFQWTQTNDHVRDRHLVISVETLRILDVEVLNFCDIALDADPTVGRSEVLAAANLDFDDVSARDTVLLPRLRKLVVANDHRMPRIPEVPLINVLMDFVRKRWAVGLSEIDQIHFSNCRAFSAHSMTPLESLVRVSWDGIAGPGDQAHSSLVD